MHFSVLRPWLTAALVSLMAPVSVAAQETFAPGWDLDPGASTINFRSDKFQDGKQVVETHSFATFSGGIEPDGKAKITVKLDSVNTNNDLRNVRMRFLFFETFKFPEATVTLEIPADVAARAASEREIWVSLPVTIDIHGVSRTLDADVHFKAEDDDTFVVSSSRPMDFQIPEFGLQDNLTKIAETAGGFTIQPVTNLTYSLKYTRRAPPAVEDEIDISSARSVVGTPATEADAPEPVPEVSAALETQGDFSMQECVGRFEILSETGNIYFASGSARLQDDSVYVLKTITDIISRCPGLRVLISGHTDSDGSAAFNQALSEKRAASVKDYLTAQGIDSHRLITTGFGEERPMVPNTSDFNKSRNRRIQFSLFQ